MLVILEKSPLDEELIARELIGNLRNPISETNEQFILCSRKRIIIDKFPMKIQR